MHRGIHLEFAIGPAWNSIQDDVNSDKGPVTREFSGAGLSWELRAGYSIIPNLVLTGDILSTTLYDPHLESSQETYMTGQDFTANETMIGGGITWYIPADFYAGFSYGLGNFRFKNGNTILLSDLDNGNSWNLRLGKHWWISDMWGINCSANIGTTEAQTSSDPCCGLMASRDHLRSYRFSILAGIGLR